MRRGQSLILRGVCTAILALSTVLLGASDSQAKKLALLIGVSDYEHPKITKLKGPPNDIAAIWALLKKRGFKSQNIRVVADGLDSADGPIPVASPTHANILGQFDALVDGATKGDFLFIYFSGHGTTMPEQQKDLSVTIEPDALDEVFLPIDIGNVNPKTNGFDNGLIDDEINERLVKIQQRQSYAWIVFDSCNSGDMIRGAESEATPRYVDPVILGVPPETLSKTSSPDGKRERLGPLDLKAKELPNITAFSAAVSGQFALEQPLPDRDGQTMGIFTYALIRNIELYPQATYRQLAQAIAQEYDTFSPSVPTPLFEGNLDVPVFGERVVTGASAWKARADGGVIDIKAGRLSGLDEGAIIELHPFADADRSLGFARVTRAELSASQAEPSDQESVSAPELPNMMLATMASRGFTFGLTIARPPESDRAQSGEVLETIKALEKLPVKERGFAWEWVDAEQNADIYLRIRGNRIYFVPPSGEIVENGREATPSLAVEPTAKNVEQLRDNLLRIARYFNLLRLAQVVDDPASEADGSAAEGVGADSLMIRAFLVRDESNTTTERRSCPKVPVEKIPKAAVPLDPEQPPQLFHCDVVYLELRNRGNKPIDTTILYVDSRYGIESFELNGPVRIKTLGRDEARPRLIPIQIVTWGRQKGSSEPGPLSTGMERIVIIGVERDTKDSDMLSFAYWAQPGLRATQYLKRGGSATVPPFSQLLQDAALSPVGTRAATSPSSSEIESATMRTFRWDVQPSPRSD